MVQPDIYDTMSEGMSALLALLTVNAKSSQLDSLIQNRFIMSKTLSCESIQMLQ